MVIKNMRKYLSLAIATLLIAVACERENLERILPQPRVDVQLDGKSVIDSAPVVFEFESSCTFTFTAQSVSKLLLFPPEGWQSVLSTKDSVITVTAPRYDDLTCAPSGDIVIRAYDGSGSYIETKFGVSTVEGEASFAITDPDLTQTIQFTLGSVVDFTCEHSPSVIDYDFTLPAGWKAVKTAKGFTVTAPVYSPESGDAQEGDIVVTPKTRSGKVDALAETFHVYVAEHATFMFAEGGKVYSFDWGHAQTIDIILAGIKELKDVHAPAGWDINTDKMISEGKIMVTPPVSDTGCDLGGELYFTAIQTGNEIEVETSNRVTIRMRGVNSLDDFKAFRKAYCPSANPEGNVNSVTTTVTKGEEVEKYLVNNTLVLNTDITLATSDMVYAAYFIKRLYIDFDGRGHTITYNDVKGSASNLAFFQAIHGNVRNLNFAGKLTGNVPGDGMRLAALAAEYSKDLTFENVKVSTEIIMSKNATNDKTTFVGGVIARYSDDTPASGETYKGNEVHFVGCEMSGHLYINQTSGKTLRVGGILGHSNPANRAKVIFENCKFTGNLEFVATAQNGGSRIGGIIGNNERAAVLSGCEMTGTMTVDAKNFAIPYEGFGGLMGRRVAQADPNTYDMSVTIENCKVGNITINNGSNIDAARRNQIGLIVGDLRGASDANFKVINTTVGELIWN